MGNAERARELLGERTDEVFTEIARDMEIVVTAEVGYSIRGLYGVPGHAVQWLDDGALQIRIPSVFVSRNKGGIFVGIAGERDAARRGTLATVDLRFTEVGGERRGGTISVATRPLDGIAGFYPARVRVGASRPAIVYAPEFGDSKRATVARLRQCRTT